MDGVAAGYRSFDVGLDRLMVGAAAAAAVVLPLDVATADDAGGDDCWMADAEKDCLRMEVRDGFDVACSAVKPRADVLFAADQKG